MTRRTKGRALPYFKVQSRDPKSLAWRDRRREAFETLADARAFRTTLPQELETRVVRWDESGAAPVESEG